MNGHREVLLHARFLMVAFHLPLRKNFTKLHVIIIAHKACLITAIVFK